MTVRVNVAVCELPVGEGVPVTVTVEVPTGVFEEVEIVAEVIHITPGSQEILFTSTEEVAPEGRPLQFSRTKNQ